MFKLKKLLEPGLSVLFLMKSYVRGNQPLLPLLGHNFESTNILWDAEKKNKSSLSLLFEF